MMRLRVMVFVGKISLQLRIGPRRSFGPMGSNDSGGIRDCGKVRVHNTQQEPREGESERTRVREREWVSE